MKTTDQEIVDIENFYATATPEEAIAYFKRVSAKCFAALKILVAAVKRVFVRRKSCLAPMKCRTVIPFSYCGHTGAGLRVWRSYIVRELGVMQRFGIIQEQIAMEETLVEAQEILTNHK